MFMCMTIDIGVHACSHLCITLIDVHESQRFLLHLFTRTRIDVQESQRLLLHLFMRTCIDGPHALIRMYGSHRSVLMVQIL